MTPAPTLALVAALLLAGAAAAQPPPSPRYGDPSKPDLSGVWNPTFPTRWVDLTKDPPPLTPPYRDRLNQTRALSDAGTPLLDPVTRCLAFGMPRFLTMTFEAIQTPGQLTMVNSILTDVRRIYIGGHTPDVEPSYNGDSAARWEGDTLVVETTDLLAGTMDQYGIPHSDKLKVVERIRRSAPDTLEDQVTLTDPEALTRPWTIMRTYKLAPPGERLEEYVCENNRNLGDDGRQK